MKELDISVIDLHTSRTWRPRMYQTSNQHDQAKGSNTYTHRSTRDNKGTDRQGSNTERWRNIPSKGVNKEI